MTLEQTGKIVATIMAFDPAWGDKVTNPEATISAWHMVLEEYDYELIEVALRMHFKTCKFAPRPADLIENISKVSHSSDDSAEEQWLILRKGIGRGSWHSEEEFNKLNAIAKKVVGGASQIHSWSQTDLGAIDSYIRKNFIDDYRRVEQQQREVEKYPSNVRELIQITAKEVTYQIEQKQSEHERLTSYESAQAPMDWRDRLKWTD